MERVPAEVRGESNPVIASASPTATRQLGLKGRENRAAVPKDRQARVTSSNSADRATTAPSDRRCGAGHQMLASGDLREKHEGPEIPPHASGGRETVAPEHPRRESDVRGGLTPHTAVDGGKTLPEQKSGG